MCFQYSLHGYKWFSSAIDADIALTLARIVDKDGNAGTVSPQNSGVISTYDFSLFAVEASRNPIVV